MDTEDNGLPPMLFNPGIAELLGVHTDITLDKIEKNYPFLNKAMQFGNLSTNELLDIKDDLHISNIIQRSKMTRGEKIRAYDRGNFIETRAMLTAGLSLSKDGYLVSRLTGLYRHVETSDGSSSSSPAKKGLFGGLFGKKQNNEGGV